MRPASTIVKLIRAKALAKKRFNEFLITFKDEGCVTEMECYIARGVDKDILYINTNISTLDGHKVPSVYDEYEIEELFNQNYNETI